jgi:hypothetical protein
VPLWVRQTLFVGGVLSIPVWLAICPGRVVAAQDGGSVPFPCATGALLIAAALGLLALLGGPPSRGRHD